MKTEEVIVIDYYELEELVKKTYGIKDYEFVAVEECNNDSHHKFDVKKRALDPGNVLDKHELETLEKIKAGRVPTYSNYVIMQDLVNQGVLKPGIYMVSVSW